MKKRSVKRRSSKLAQAGADATTPAEVGHLDETITKVAKTTGIEVKKHWKALIVFLVVAVVAVSGYRLKIAMSERQTETVSKTLFDLTRTSSASDGALPDVEGIRRLVEESNADKVVLKQLVSFVLSEAAIFGKEARDAENSTSGDASIDDLIGDKPKGDPKKAQADLLLLAEEIVEKGKLKYPDDTEDILKWAGNVEKRIKDDRDWSWLPPARTYQLMLPPAATGTATDAEGVDVAPAIEEFLPPGDPSTPSTETFLPPGEPSTTTPPDGEGS